VVYLIWDRNEGINLYVRKACGGFENILEKFVNAKPHCHCLKREKQLWDHEIKGEKRRNHFRSLPATT